MVKMAVPTTLYQRAFEGTKPTETTRREELTTNGPGTEEGSPKGASEIMSELLKDHCFQFHGFI